jgi:hypothetical protein
MDDVDPVIFAIPDSLAGNCRQRIHPPIRFMLFIQDFTGITSPVIAAILLDVARGLPLTHLEIKAAKLKGWGKELSVMEQDPPDNSFHWDVMFDPLKCDQPLHDQFQPNRYANLFLYNSFSRWRDRMTTIVHYPRTSTKSMSRSTVRYFEGNTGRNRDENCVDFSQEDWLVHYHKTGVQLEGACELRQRWYKSSAKPRTYIAQGGYAYTASQCTQDFWTELVNSNPVTNHITRLQPERLRLRSGSRLRIYDLETFTSRYHEQRHFLASLAEFCRGHPFSFMDVRHGLITVDMGELISEYNQICNIRTPISFERVPGLRGHPIGCHHYASALGIYGNLMTCTLPHGCAMLHLVDTEDQVNVAGDDGALDENDDNEDTIQIAIAAQGRCEMSKAFDTREDGVICLKRDLVQTGQSVIHGILIIPPCVVSMAELLYDYTDPRYRDSVATPLDRLRRVGRELFRFIRSVHRARDGLSIMDKRICLSIFERISQKWKIDPAVGALQICGDRYSWPAILNTSNWTDVDIKEYFETDPLMYTAGQCYRGSATMSLRGRVVIQPNWDNTRCGMTFEGNSSRHWALLEKLGYVEKEPEVTFVLGSIGLQRVYGQLMSSEPRIYRYTVLRDVPVTLII